MKIKFIQINQKAYYEVTLNIWKQKKERTLQIISFA